MKKKILIVEDEALHVMFIKKVLKTNGYEICGVSATGEGAIDLARNNSPDITLMDINLADSISGIEAAREIRNFSDTPIIFVTGYEKDAILSEISDIERSMLYTKPIEIEILLEYIQECIQKFFIK
ncbi:MAG: response regulator [Leptospiraceae bacterium]|nr:response regulator [Leptospiraceae bacterium]